MNAQNTTHWLLAGVSCLMIMAPMGASAQDYLKGKTSYKPRDNKDISAMSGDFSEDFQYDGTGNPNDPMTKRQRVEARVKQYREEMAGDGGIHSHDDREHLTAEQFNALVASAQAGDAEAIGHVGYAYENGLAPEKNEQQALEWYKRAIEYGETKYYSHIGSMYRDYGAPSANSGFLGSLRKAVTGGGATGNDLPNDNKKAREWFEKGVYAKDWRSYAQLGEMYRDGAGGLPKDMEKAKWYYDEGMRLKKQQLTLTRMEKEQRFRAQAELEEGLRSADTPMVGWKKESKYPGVMVGDHYCTLLLMESPSGQYTAFYEAYCNGVGESAKRTTPPTVTVKGATCNVTEWPANEAGKNFELRCY